MGNLGSKPALVALTSGDLGADIVTAAKIADDVLNSEHYAAGSIDEEHVADNAITLAKMASGTDGNIISFDASGNPVAIATGTDGQVLTSAGAGAPPAFEAAAAGGKVLQVVSTAKTDTFGSTSPATPEDVTGMSVSITPSATSSKVLLTVSVAYSGSTDNDTYFRILRGSTAIAIGNAAGSRDRCWFELPRSHSSGNVMSGANSLTFLDSPSTTSATTYKLQVGGTSDTAQMYVNRGVGDGDYSGNGRGFSSITAMEIGA
jgi:hypothetical protein